MQKQAHGTDSSFGSLVQTPVFYVKIPVSRSFLRDPYKPPIVVVGPTVIRTSKVRSVALVTSADQRTAMPALLKNT